jgi:integral membrane sensor domain MASE1
MNDIKPGIWTYLGMFLVTLAGTRFSVVGTTMPAGFGILWVPNAVLLAYLLRFAGKGGLLFCGLFCLAVFSGDPSDTPLIFQLFVEPVDAASAVFIYAVVSNWGMSKSIESLRDLGKFAICGPLAGTLVFAIVGASIYWVIGNSQDDLFFDYRVWWVSDGLGVLIFTPLVLSWLQPDALRWPRLKPYDYPALLLSVIVIICVFALRLTPFLTVPVVAYAAWRFERRLSLAVMAGISMGVPFMLARGMKPLGDVPDDVGTLRTQGFILIIAVLGAGLSTWKRQREAASS